MGAVADLSEAAQYLRRPGLQRLWAGARERWEANGGPSGLVRIDALSADEAHDVSGLIGPLTRRRIDAGQDLRVTLPALDRALGTSRFALSVTDALELVGGALRSRPAERSARQAQADAFWASHGAHAAVADPSVAQWLAVVRRTGGLARLARRDRGRPLRVALDALARLPADPPLERAALAAELAGDPHALDDGTAGGALALSALAMRAGEPAPGDARERRALWERFGVLCDRISSTVLAVNLPLLDDPLRAMFAAWPGQAVSLTLGQLRSAAVQVPAGTQVYCSENPTVLSAAAARLGAACPPLVCVSGQPTVAVLCLLEQLAGSGARLRYHGDFDAGGLRVVGRLAAAVPIEPWRFDAASYSDAVARHLGTTPVAGEVADPPGFEPLAAAIRCAGVAVYEEQLLADLLGDLADRRP
jgi:uncharacterized protein (TIGR02679 family)